MAFNFELKFTGLVLLAFRDSTYSSGHAILIRSNTEKEGEHNHMAPGHGDEMSGHSALEHLHRSSLAYEPKYLITDEDEPGVIPDPLFVDPQGRRIASRQLENEILTVSPSWPDEGRTPPPGISILRKPEGVSMIGQEAIREGWLDHTAVMSRIEPRLVQAQEGHLDTAIRPECLARSLAPNSPAIARVDFDQGQLVAGDLSRELWDFRQIGTSFVAHSGTEQFLASSVTLRLDGVSSVALKSDQRPDLRFKTIAGTIETSVTNELQYASPWESDYLDHFTMFYRATRIQDQDSIVNLGGLRVPHVHPESPRTIDNKICPVATVHL